MIKFGITERGDAGLDLSWLQNLQPANILITKNLNDNFIQALICAHQESKIITHITCTGFGGKPVEKNVPTKEWTHQQVIKLLESGHFPVEQLVLRIDPIVPTDRGIQTALSVLELFKDTGIKRVRYSFMDMYHHVKERFRQQGIPIPYETFSAPITMQKKAIYELSKYDEENILYQYQFESCAENTPHKLGCISEKDFKILDIPNTEMMIKLKGQRSDCLCVGNKYELLTSRRQCDHKCSYCFWK